MTEKALKEAADVLSVAPSGEEMAMDIIPGALLPIPKTTIPLLCIVCPEAPKFSDISHLLTHIASKGHLHHETQTKLRAHQDQVAASTLQQYEIWYTQHGIEGLLVERMRAKQSKMSKQTRHRNSSAAIKSQTTTQTPSHPGPPFIKQEDMEDPQTTPGVPIYPGFLDDNVESATLENSSLSSEPMSLKGLVWPGIGKLDLADEEMRRTRNQRKPKSVIDKMRRTSEGIEPDQVVMTSDFEVEVVKSVYEETPPPTNGNSDEDEQPREEKRARVRRRVGRPPLAETSANVPRGGRATRKRASKQAKPDARHIPKAEEIDLFGDEHRELREVREALEPTLIITDLKEASFGTYNHRESRFNPRSRATMGNASSANFFDSPSPLPREQSYRGGSTTNFVPERVHPQSHWNHNGLMPVGPEGAYMMNDASIYNNSTRLPFSAGPFLSFAQNEHYRAQANHHYFPKQEDHPHHAMMNGATRAPQYVNVSGANPLLGHDRLFSGAYSAANNHQGGQPDHASGFHNVEVNRDHHRNDSQTLHHGNNFHGPRCEKSVTVEPTTERVEG